MWGILHCGGLAWKHLFPLPRCPRSGYVALSGCRFFRAVADGNNEVGAVLWRKCNRQGESAEIWLPLITKAFPPQPLPAQEHSSLDPQQGLSRQQGAGLSSLLTGHQNALPTGGDNWVNISGWQVGAAVSASQKAGELWGVTLCSLHAVPASAWFLFVLRLPPTVQKHTCEVNRQL